MTTSHHITLQSEGIEGAELFKHLQKNLPQAAQIELIENPNPDRAGGVDPHLVQVLIDSVSSMETIALALIASATAITVQFIKNDGAREIENMRKEREDTKLTSEEKDSQNDLTKQTSTIELVIHISPTQLKALNTIDHDTLAELTGDNPSSNAEKTVETLGVPVAPALPNGLSEEHLQAIKNLNPKWVKSMTIIKDGQ